MQRSFEVRWFIPADDAASIGSIKDWYQNSGFKAAFSTEGFPRQDYYLVIDNPHLGIKIREPKEIGGNKMTKLEIKQFVGDLEKINKNINGKGHADEWVKFSFSLQPDEQLAMDIIDSFCNRQHADLNACWVEMKKDRLLLKYHPADGKLYEENEQLDEGCGIEFTRLMIDDREHYSFGLEAFSGSGSGAQNLAGAIDKVMAELGHLPFTGFSSLSYPKFLLHTQP